MEDLKNKWENNFKKIDWKWLPLEEWSAYWAINEFIKDLSAMQSSEVDVEKIYYNIMNDAEMWIILDQLIEWDDELLEYIIKKHLSTSKVKEETPKEVFKTNIAEDKKVWEAYCKEHWHEIYYDVRWWNFCRHCWKVWSRDELNK